MKFIASLAAAAALTLAGGVAIAQDVGGLEQYFSGLKAEGARDFSGAALVDYIFGGLERDFGVSPDSRHAGRLPAAGKVFGAFNVLAYANYTVIGACDKDCSDVVLVVRDPSGNEVGYHEPARARNGAPVVYVAAPSSAGRYTFEMQMVTCSSSCNWGVKSYQTRRLLRRNRP